MRVQHSLLLLSAAVFVSSGCAGPTEGEGEGDVAEGEGEGEGESDIVLDETQNIRPDTTVDPFDVILGGGLSLAVRSDGRYAFAFMTDGDGSTVTCENFSGETPPPAPLKNLVVIDEQADGSQRTRIVDTFPIQQSDDNIDMQVDPTSDALVISYLGGEIAREHCGASDLMLAVESGDTFTISPLATDSNSGSGPCRTLQSVCAKGDVVGEFPALALSDARSAFAYLDIHFGFAADDIFGSDLEIGSAGGSVPTGATIETECGDSAAGNHSGIALTSDGRIAVAHGVIASNNLGPVDAAGTIPCPSVGPDVGILHKGIWGEYEQADGTYQETVIIDNGDTTQKISVADREGQGTFALIREEGTKQLVLARTVDEGVTWTLEFPEQLALTGFSPTIGFLSDGTQVLAYGHCSDLGTDAACNPAVDGTRITWRDASETVFHKKTFTGDDEDQDSKKTDMAIAPDDTIVVVSFNLTQDQFVIQRFHKTP